MIDVREIEYDSPQMFEAYSGSISVPGPFSRTCFANAPPICVGLGDTGMGWTRRDTARGMDVLVVGLE